MKKIQLANATGMVTSSPFVKACVAYQQSKRALSELLNGADTESLDNVSTAIYDLVNKALHRNRKSSHAPIIRAIKRGERRPHHENIAVAVRGKGSFKIEDVVAGMKKRKTLPQAENINGYISTLLGAHPEMFHRVERGVYRLRGRRLIMKKKAKAELPAATQ